ncbi:hypothetical protein [Bhargavaea cecembensis]|uniref:hypothetical protein n=1 Tax=Bhargavaea cecembensis TaxID=394098 RepID=UPI0015CF0935|nr:hypothetical protein [Bhargavaea cecembensis]
MIQFVENTAVELKDGRRGLIIDIRDMEGIVQYDVELGDGEIVTVFAEEVRRPV